MIPKTLIEAGGPEAIVGHIVMEPRGQSDTWAKSQVMQWSLDPERARK
jgi:hypothetical protein